MTTSSTQAHVPVTSVSIQPCDSVSWFNIHIIANRKSNPSWASHIIALTVMNYITLRKDTGWKSSVSTGCYKKYQRLDGLNNTCICHSSGGFEVQDQGARRFDSWWGLSSWLADSCLLAIFSQGEERKLWCHFSSVITGTKCHHGGLTLMISWKPDYFLKALPPRTIT